MNQREFSARVMLLFITATLLGSVATSQTPLEIDRHQASPCCWGYWVGRVSDLPAHLANLTAAGDRVMDVSTYSGSFVEVIGICGGNTPGSPYERAHAVDIGVSSPGAVLVAQTLGMMVTSLAHVGGTSSSPTFVSLREAVPAGVNWALVPSRTSSGIIAWLAANPTFEPYAVDVAVIAGQVEYYVFALESMVDGPLIRSRNVHFSQAVSSVPFGIYPRPNLVIDIAHDSLTTVAYIEEIPLPGDDTPSMSIIDRANPPVGNAQLERWVVSSSFSDASGQEVHSALRVNNAWSLYDVHYYPPQGPFADYRGSPVTLGIATLGVVSSTPGIATAGSNLTYSVSPVFFGGAAYILTSFDRIALDLAPYGAPGVLLTVPQDVVQFAPIPPQSITATVQQVIPNIPGLNGIRFYAQGVVFEPGVFATTNMYAITVQ